MNTRLFLPIAAISALALAACERAEAPRMPDPDADAQVQVQPEVERGMSETAGDVEISEQDIEQTVEEIQQEAAESFESIMERIGQAGESGIGAGTGAMQTITDQMEQAGASAEDSLERQIDAIIEGVSNFSAETMTDEERIQVIASARTAAEQAARNLGRSETEVINAGDEAESRARELMGL